MQLLCTEPILFAHHLQALGVPEHVGATPVKSVAPCQVAAFFSDGHSIGTSGRRCHLAGLAEDRLEELKKEKTMHLVKTFGDQIDGKLTADSIHPGHILFPHGFREEGSQPGRHVVHLLQQTWIGERVMRRLIVHTAVDIGEL